MNNTIGISRTLVAAGALLLTTPTLTLGQPLELPKESPLAKVSQQIGLTEVAVEYGSPAVKGRRIWGGVVPYDKPWSISPHPGVTLRFDREVLVGEKAVAAGTYRLTAVPTKESWTVILTRAVDKEADGASAPVGPAKLDTPAPEPIVASIKVAPKAAAHRERLSFQFADFTDDKASLELEWEKLRVTIPLATRTAEQIKVSLSELDTAWRSYANAARFMLETKKDYDAGLRYANQSLALKEDWYTFWIKAALHAAKRDYKGAVEQGERAYELGKKSGDGFALESELRKSIGDWKKKRERPSLSQKE